MAAAERAVELATAKRTGEAPHVFTGSVEHAIAHIEESISSRVPAENLRWYAIKLFERDEKVIEELNLSEDLRKHLEEHVQDCEAEMDDDSESIITNQRYAYISKVMDRCVRKKIARHDMTTSDKIDRIVTNRILALPIFAVIMFAVYWVAMGPLGTFLTDWTNDTLGAAWLQEGSRALLEGWGCAEWLTGLVSDGIVAGVGAVLGFVPQMLVLFLMLSILEDIGYMARVAFIMDRIFRKFGLSGKSFIPMLIGSGCGVPGVMASRTIENERDRRMTIMTTCFVPCGAKMPIIGLFAGALFNGSGLVATSAYFIGVAAIIVSGILLKKMKSFAGEPAPFVMELPAYHVPSYVNVLRATWERGWSFHQAGRHHHSGLLRDPVVPAGLRRGGWPLWNGRGQQYLAFGEHWHCDCLYLCAAGFRRLAVHRGDHHRPDCKGKCRFHLRCFVPCGCRSSRGRSQPVAGSFCALYAVDRLQLHDLQPAVCTVLCGNGRNQA